MLGSGMVEAGHAAGQPTELTLVRHGQTEWHADNRYAGSTDLPLDDVGQAQAKVLARWVSEHPYDAVYCSPLRRARETATPAATALGVEPMLRPGLREMDFGLAEGRTLNELRQQDPKLVSDFLADPVGHSFPGAEPPEAVARRVREVLRELADRHRGGSVLVVGHNTALRLALCDWLGIPLARYRDVLPRLDNCAITRLRVPADPNRPPALLSLNVPVGIPGKTTSGGVPGEAPGGVTGEISGRVHGEAPGREADGDNFLAMSSPVSRISQNRRSS